METTVALEKKPENGSTEIAKKPATLQNILAQDSVKKRFEDMLGKKAAGFISSIISAVKTNPDLGKCPPDSIISAAAIAATLDLPIQNNLGFAALVPYQSGDTLEATFQMMWRGYVQLAMRTAQYLTINVSEVYEGELISENRITGEYVFDTSKKSTDKIIGYVAYFKMVNGFYKYWYWTSDRIYKHAKQYSQSFRSQKDWVVKKSRWTVDFDAMAKKTVLKLLLSKYGILSVDMQIAFTSDFGVIKDVDTLDVDYVDNKPEEVDKEAERVELMIEDAKTPADLDKIAEHIQPEQRDLFNSKLDQLLSQEPEIKKDKKVKA